MLFNQCLATIFPELYDSTPAPPRKGLIKPCRSPLSELITGLKKTMEEEVFDLSDAEEYYDACFDSTSSTNSSESKLLRLPPELLTLIVEHCLDLARDGTYITPGSIQCLKSLRLAHPHFAHLRFVRKELYKTLHLTTDPVRLRTLDRDINSISHFVRRVVFQPYIVGRDNFPECRKKDPIQRVQEMMGVRVAKLIGSGRVEAVWCRTLRQLPRVSDFLVDAEQTSTWGRIVCGPSAHTLMRLALESLTTCGVSAPKAALQYRADDEFIWTKMEAWEQLPVDHLRDLIISFDLEVLSRRWDYRQTYRVESSTVVSNLLLRSQGTLRNLVLSNDALSCLSPHQSRITSLPLPLPQLRSLSLKHGTVSADRLASCLTRCVGLSSLSLDSIHVDVTSEMQNWAPIFTAIRHHPNDLLIDLKNVEMYSAARHTSLSLRHQVPELPKLQSHQDVISTEIANMIASFISKRGEWKLEERWDPANYEPSDAESEFDYEHDYDEAFIPSMEDDFDTGDRIFEDYDDLIDYWLERFTG